METYHLEKDIDLLCIQAVSFPDGVMAAHEKLHALLPDHENRMFYGLSSPDKTGTIVYKAAAEVLFPGEAQQLNCEPYTLQAGEYISIFIPDFCDDVQAIGQAFQKLIHLPDIDPNGICVEMYLSEKDVRCMVKLK